MVCGFPQFFKTEREATQAVLTALIIKPVERLINFTLFIEHCPNLFQSLSLTEICFSVSPLTQP